MKNLYSMNVSKLNDKELKNVNGGTDFGDWVTDRLADAYCYFFCGNLDNGYYFNPRARIDN